MVEKHIVFIDDGVNDARSMFTFLYDLEISADHANFTNRESYDRSKSSHGTICAHIVNAYYPHFLCSSLKILDDETKKCNIDALRAALEWCLEQKVDIVNISLGSTDYRDERKLLPLVNRLAHKGVTLVCAVSNSHEATYPASFCNVIGVVSSTLSDQEKVLFCNASAGGIDIAVPSNHLVAPVSGQIRDTGIANSYAAPYAVALICIAFNDTRIPDNETVKRRLMSLSENGSGSRRVSCIRFDWAMNVSIVSTDLFLPEGLPFEVTAFRHRNTSSPLFCLEHIPHDTADTVVFIWREALPEKEKQVAVDVVAGTGKHIVIIDDYPSVSPDFSQCRGKVWYSGDWQPFFHKEAATGTALSVPLLVVYDNHRERLLEISTHLANSFREAGYNAMLSSSDPLIALKGHFYIPYLQTGDTRFLCYLQNFYRADLLICGVCIGQDSPEAYVRYFTQLSADISVGFVDIGRNTDKEVVYVHVQDGGDFQNDSLNLMIEETNFTADAVFSLLLPLLEQGGAACV